MPPSSRRKARTSRPATTGHHAGSFCQSTRSGVRRLRTFSSAWAIRIRGQGRREPTQPEARAAHPLPGMERPSGGEWPIGGRRSGCSPFRPMQRGQRRSSFRSAATDVGCSKPARASLRRDGLLPHRREGRFSATQTTHLGTITPLALAHAPRRGTLVHATSPTWPMGKPSRGEGPKP